MTTAGNDKSPSPTPSLSKEALGKGSVDSHSPEGVYDPVLDKRVWRKLDWLVLPTVAMFYLLSFLDRTNIGNARVAGMQQDLKMSNHEYSIALTVTYVPYIAAELPSNLLLRAVGPNYLLPTLLTLWGVVTTCQGAVTTYRGLLACRFFLGLLEGGVFPGLVLYLSMFYPRSKMNLRVTGFFSSASISGAFGGILAYGLVRINFRRPGWAWVFIVEGAFTILFGLLSFFILPRSPQTAAFFTVEEKEYVIQQLKEDGAAAQNEEAESFSWPEAGKAFLLPQVLLTAGIFFLDGVILYGLAYFAPSIIQGLGYTAARAQLMSVPPFAAAFVVAMGCAYISDKYRARGLVTIGGSIACIIGFAMFLRSSSNSVKYASLFFSITGTYVVAPTVSAWGANNAAPHTRRATAIAIGFIMSNSGGILATWLLGSLSPAPLYISATITLLVMSVAMVLLAAANIAYLSAQNKQKAKIRLTTSRENEEPGLGDKSAWFIYNL